QLMIISNDGYAFAEGARDMIAGFHQPNDLSYYGSSLSTLTYWLYKITPFSFESIILYMSTFLSSLVVIPIILLANEYKRPLMGFVAALLASIANSYYNRTMSGYYDTDMLVIVYLCL
ncbi:dolichyl-diphosphooligosaccharide--protein glycosyltransferase subunit STT3, partial [Campylobacter jejuni]|nr:dolichyl-diphosphooligosaccharide--protein glycosyltransferase subunit STT3 [Campylobacter jejuni]